MQANLEIYGSDSIPNGTKPTRVNLGSGQVITGSTHRRQAPAWLAHIDKAKSMQELDKVGSVFGSDQMTFEAQGFTNCERPSEHHEPRVQETNSVGRRGARKQEYPDVARKTDPVVILAQPFCTSCR